MERISNSQEERLVPMNDWHGYNLELDSTQKTPEWHLGKEFWQPVKEVQLHIELENYKTVRATAVRLELTYHMKTLRLVRYHRILLLQL